MAIAQSAPEPHVPRAHPLDVRAHVIRLYGTERLHRVVPDRIALALAAAVGRARWLWPPARRRAIGRVSLTVAGTGRETEVRALARRELIVGALRTERTWRPWLDDGAPVAGRELLDAALASGRPVMLAGTHLGSGFLRTLGRDWQSRVVTVTGPWMAPADGRLPRGYVGHVALAVRRRWDADGTRVLAAGGAYPLLREELLCRNPCLLMFDLAGESRVRMAGKSAYVRTGIAQLAIETDALVVPIVALVERSERTARVLEPIDPREAAGVEELLQRLASAFGDLVVRHPEQMQPLPGLRELWRDERAAYAVELWKPPRLRVRALSKARAVRSRLLSPAG